MFKIKQLLTSQNRKKSTGERLKKYIVVHYTGGLGSAKANAEYYASKYIGSSAHLFLDEGETVYQSVLDNDVAWHCGANKYYHKECRNANSIGVEVVPKKISTKTKNATDTDWYFTEETLNRLEEVLIYLMKKYNIPIQNVVRHYDVTHKICPNPFSVNARAHTEWKVFKDRLEESLKDKKPEDKKQANFLIRVTVSSLNIYKGAGTKFGVAGTIKDKGTYTITETSGNWGKLKSGAGWINLSSTKKL